MIQDLQDITSFKWATVTDDSPLTIRMDGDTAPLLLVPESLIDPATLLVNDRVRVELSLRKCVIHGRAGGLQLLQATTTRVGPLELATSAETIAVTDPDRGVTPLGLGAALGTTSLVGARRIQASSVAKSGGGTVVTDADGTVRVTANGPTAISLNGILAVNSITVLEIHTLTSAASNNTFRFRKAGVDLSGSNYVFEGVFITSTWIGAQSPGGYGATATESLLSVNGQTTGHHLLTILGNNAQSSRQYHFHGRTRGSNSTSFVGGGDNNSGTYDHDGITVLPGGATTFQVGTEIRVWRLA